MSRPRKVKPVYDTSHIARRREPVDPRDVEAEVEALPAGVDMPKTMAALNQWQTWRRAQHKIPPPDVIGKGQDTSINCRGRIDLLARTLIPEWIDKGRPYDLRTPKARERAESILANAEFGMQGNPTRLYNEIAKALAQYEAENPPP